MSKLRLESEKEDSRYVPVHIARPLLEECGYRCSNPTCKGTSSLQLEHIDDWSKLEFKKHDFDKMIVLCATCHARVTSKEIHKDSIRGYKRNLAVISGRYSLFEIRLIERYREAGLKRGSETHLVHDSKIPIPSIFNETETLHLAGLIRDGLVSVREHNFNESGNPFITQIDKMFDAETAKSIKATKNLTAYLIMPTFKCLDFIDDYFGGVELS